MKPLAQMTHEELYSLDRYQLIDLCIENGLTPEKIGAQPKYVLYWAFELADALEKQMLSLQQSAADASRDTLEDR